MEVNMERKMSAQKTELLEDIEGISIIVGFIIGINILTMPSLMARYAKQDGWMTTIIGGIYPLIISMLLTYYVKKHPNENILILSKKYLGKILGTICNIFFMFNFIVYFISVAVGLSNVLIVHATTFLTPLKIYIPCILLALYLSSMGIKVLGRINKLALFLMLALGMAEFFILRRGTVLNVLPVFESGYKNILRGSLQSAYAYGGVEGIFLLYPYLKNKNKIKAISLKATAISVFLYSWIIFLCIFYLGYAVTIKNLWPALLVTESVNLPIINSIRFPFLFLWILIAFKTLANNFFSIMFITSDMFKKNNSTKFYVATSIFLLALCFMVENETQRRRLMDIFYPINTLISIVYITIIALFIYVNDKSKKSKQKNV